MASSISSSDKKVSLKKSWDEEEGMSTHSEKEYWSSSFPCKKQTVDLGLDFIIEYDNSVSNNGMVLA